MLEEASLFQDFSLVALGIGMNLGHLYIFLKRLVTPSYPLWLLGSHTWGCGRTVNTRNRVFPEKQGTLIFTQGIHEVCPYFCQDTCLPTSCPGNLAEWFSHACSSCVPPRDYGWFSPEVSFHQSWACLELLLFLDVVLRNKNIYTLVIWHEFWYLISNI